VSLVDAYETEGRELADVVHEICEETLRGYVEQLDLALFYHGQNPGLLVVVEERADASSREIGRKVVDLVEHQ
jgi:hypothetical protein